ncbi:hypothetical protein OV207_13310 [Corallococcus sp. BB11-1]|uniref:hypothetical protein n=1 Tax=Corallococcus sp. BB11-1 TaxID=2996783 RepID=UPI00226FCED9|nr:hypothetical protein [Corallococcus sp. BB11-1]MCY1032444.1 hypothetical protein [Corallococcus sp. BB11-1]
MNWKTSSAVRLLALSLFAWGASASAQTFSLTPPCAPGLCGASKIGGAAVKPAGATRETQSIEVDVAATALLQSSSEHIAISGFASGQPFNTTGAFSPNAPNGGIGIALGRIDNAAHPSCPADASDTQVEFAIEQFGWSDIYGSRILDCVSFSKSALSGVWKLRISLFVQCWGATCSAAATVENASTFALLGSVSSTAIPLQNPTIARRPWYAVTNFAAEPFNYSASFWVRDETYTPFF